MAQRNIYKKAIKYGKAILNTYPEIEKRKFRALLGYHLNIEETRKLTLLLDFLEAFGLITISDQKMIRLHSEVKE